MCPSHWLVKVMWTVSTFDTNFTYLQMTNDLMQITIYLLFNSRSFLQSNPNSQPQPVRRPPSPVDQSNLVLWCSPWSPLNHPLMCHWNLARKTRTFRYAGVLWFWYKIQFLLKVCLLGETSIYNGILISWNCTSISTVSVCWSTGR